MIKQPLSLAQNCVKHPDGLNIYNHVIISTANAVFLVFLELSCGPVL